MAAFTEGGKALVFFNHRWQEATITKIVIRAAWLDLEGRRLYRFLSELREVQ